MNTEDVLNTKLYIPRTRPEIVTRPRLISQLNEGLHRKLTLISAPAGFGKTTLVTEWLDNLRLNVRNDTQVVNKIAWLSLDEGDNDLVRFLTYFIAALKQIEGIDATFGKGVLSMLQSPQPPPTETVLTSLINEIAAISDRIILVLDDYHLIEIQPIHDVLTFLLEHLPPQLHVVIATREDPHLPLARLRAQNQLIELRAAELRFTSSEAVKFLNQVMGLDLSAEDIVALENRTEGWIAGLQLAAISIRGQTDTTSFIKSFTGSHRLVLDYLVEEVLGQQSENIQIFLMRTAILNRLTGPLCDALTGQDNGEATLEMLEKCNMFIVPLDGERRWYRYHHLFADILRQRLHQTEHEHIPLLHHSASEWYAQNGSVDEAIQHAIYGDDFDRAATLIEKHLDALWQRGEYTNLQHWLTGLPDELVISKPNLCILNAWDLFHCGQRDGVERSLQAAKQALETGTVGATGTPLTEKDQLLDSERMQIQGRTAVIRAYQAAYRGDAQGANKYARQALKYLPQHDLAWRSTTGIASGDANVIRGNIAVAYQTRIETVEKCTESGHIYLILIAYGRLAETLRQQGKLRQVIDLCKQQMQYANECGISQTVAAGWLMAIWSEVLAELNNLDPALNKALEGMEVAERGGRDVAFFGWSSLYLLRVLFSRGDLTDAEEIIQKMEKTVREYDMPILVPVQISAWQARIWLAQNKLDAASQWVEERVLDADGELSFLREIEYVVLARILIAQEKIDDAIRLLRRLLKAAKAGKHTSRVIEILILQAVAFQAGSDTTQAMAALKQALILAQPEGFIRIFVDEGPPMKALLRKMKVEDRKMKVYVRKLLSAFADKEFHPSSLADQPLIEPLSDREIEVLQCLATGLTNREIAAQLYLAVNTVKVHTRNIYGKLGVNNRTQAVAQARALGILLIN